MSICWSRFVKIFILLCVVLSYFRLYFGVDFTDESFYIALPYRFSLGDIPIRDEYSLLQLPTLLLYPFFKIYSSIFNTEGIVLFARHLYFMFFCGLSFLCYVSFKKELGRELALLVASICFIFVPFNISGLSYNSLAIFFYTAGCLLTFISCQKNFVGYHLTVATFLYSLACFSYLPFIFPIFVNFIIICYFNSCKDTIISFIKGSIPITCFIIWVLYLAGPYEVRNVLGFLSQTGVTDRDVYLLLKLVSSWRALTPNLDILMTMLALLLLNVLRKNVEVFRWLPKTMVEKCIRLENLIAVVLPFVLIPFFLTYALKKELAYLYSSSFFINFSLLAPFYYIRINKNSFMKRIFFILWVPSLIAGLTTGLSSSNGYMNCIIGLFPGFIASLIIVGHGVNESLINLTSYIKSNRKKQLVDLSSYFLVSLIISCSVFFKFVYVYRDDSVLKLANVIHTGPFKYLLTTAAKKKNYEKISSDLQSINVLYKPKTILFYPDFSVGYLLSQLSPLTNSVWLFKLDNLPVIEYFKKRQKNPDVVFFMSELMANSRVAENDSLLLFIQNSNYHRLISNELYQVYIRSDLINKRPMANNRNLFPLVSGKHL